MHLLEWIDRKRAELRRLGPTQARNITPSLRDFAHAVTTRRQALAVIAEIARRTPEEGELAESVDIAGLCAAMDQASVSAVAVATDGEAFGGSGADLQRAAQASSAPILCHDLILSREQLYLARLGGADAVLLLAGALSAPELRPLIEIASSMHMASPVEVRSERELADAVAAGARLLVIPAFDGSSLSLALPEALLPKVPRGVTPLVRGPFSSAAELEPLRGKADGLWLTGPVMRATDPLAFLGPLVEAAENG